MKLQATLQKVFLRVFLFSVLLLTTPLVTEAAGCDHTIGLSTKIADARSNYSAVQPGDTVCIVGGDKDELLLRNFEGTAENPITFINTNGQVIINSTVTHGILIQNSRFFRLTGSGTEGITYGIKIVDSKNTGIDIGRKSSNFEVDHVEISGVDGIGIHTKTDATCSDGSTNKYDYDGDGVTKGDLDDVVNRDNFTQFDFVIHDNYVHNIGRTGLYIGSSFYQGKDLTCNSGTETVYAPLLKGASIYNNITEDTGRRGMHAGSTTEDCVFHHNKVYRYGQANVKNMDMGIMVKKGSVCNVYNNFIKDGTGSGIFVNGSGGNKIYNNVIVNPGQNKALGNNDGDGIIVRTGSNLDNSVYVWNNTIVTPKNFGIKWANKKGSDNKIQNNIIIAPENYNSYGENAYIQTWGGTNVTVSHNLKSQNISDIKFTAPELDDYSLQTGSPAIDMGADLSSQGIATDYKGVFRPQEAEFDVGAFESGNSAPPPPTTEPTPLPTDDPIITPTPEPTSPATESQPTIINMLGGESIKFNCDGRRLVLKRVNKTLVRATCRPVK